MEIFITVQILAYVVYSSSGHVDAALLSRHKTVTSSSQFLNWAPSRAVDGDIAFSADACQCCASTIGQLSPWYQLDLGQFYTVNRIVVEGRRDHLYGQHFEGMRILLHSIYNGFDNFDTSVSEKIFNYSYTLPQPKSTRYVSMVLFDITRVFTICELSVFGDCQVGDFGDFCEKRCFCQGGPCGGDGTCPSGVCMPGYKGVACDTECVSGTYGSGCTETCGKCYGAEVCERFNGSCSRCETGYSGSTCKQECQMTYGQDCVNPCGNCLRGAPCHHVTGSCRDVCDQGYRTPVCDQVCKNGTYGYNCNETCGNCTGDDVCALTDGACPNGCKAGYKGRTCKAECDDGFYGGDCLHPCGFCKAGTLCHKESGVCDQGCIPRYNGSLCTQFLGEEAEPQSGLGAAIGGGVGGVVAVVIAVVLVVFMVIRTKRRKKMQDKGGNTDQFSNSPERGKSKNADGNKKTAAKYVTNTNKRDRTEASNVTDNHEYYGFLVRKTDLTICQLWGYICQKKKGGDVMLFQEYNDLTPGLKHPHDVASDVRNHNKNRYKAICAYDHNRVQLAVEKDTETDYINASYIEDVNGAKKFIASQGPTKHMRNDFLRMILQKNVEQIVMLTNLIERGNEKCLIYWPEDSATDVTYGDLTVKLVSETSTTDQVIRTLSIGENDSWTNVKQYHFKSWPDKDVPDSTWPLLKFWRTILADRRDGAGPILVHCSTGIGRTGTFIAMDYAYHKAKSTGVVNMLEVVETLRKQRTNMVQTKEQYVFLHEAVSEALLFGTQFLWPRDYIEIHEFMMQVDKDSKKQRLKMQFDYIVESIEDRKRMEKEKTHTTDEVYMNLLLRSQQPETKVAIDDFVPQSRSMERLKDLDAVLLPGYEGQQVFIALKMPIDTDFGGLWSLVAEQNVRTIVTIQDESSQKNRDRSLGARDNFSKSKHGIKLEQELTSKAFVERRYTYETAGSEIEVSHFDYKMWTHKQAIPDDTTSMLEFLEATLDKQQRLIPTQPVVVLCSNEYERSGLVCVLLNELERMRRDDGHINIVQSVKMMKERREDIVPNYEQYKYIHGVILETFHRHNVYANC